MLQICIDNQAMDLAHDFSMTLTQENAMFQDDGLVPVPFTTTIEFLKTSRNLRILGHPDRINIKADPFRDHRCDILFDGKLLASGIFNLEDCGEKLEGNFAGAEVLSLTKTKCLSNNHFTRGLAIGNYRHTAKGIPSDSSQFSVYNALAGWAEDMRIEEERLGNPQPIIFAPIRDLSRDYDPQVSISHGNLRRMFMNPYNHNGFISNGIVGAFQPAVRIGWLLDKIFDGQLDNNIFNQGEFQKLVLVFLHHPTLEEGNIPFPYTHIGASNYHSFFLQYFMPEITQMDMVRELLKIFALTLVCSQGRFRLIRNSDILMSESTTDIRKYRPTMVSMKREKGKFYQYGYEDMECETPEEYLAVSSPSSLWSYSTNDSEMICYSSLTNQYISKERSDNYVQKWNYKILDGGWGGNREPDDPEKDTWNMRSKIKPLDNSYHNVWSYLWPNTNPANGWPGPSMAEYHALHVPEAEGYAKVDAYPNIMIWHGYRTLKSRMDGTLTYPYLTGKRYDADGNFLSSLSLESDRLMNSYHDYFSEWIGKDKKAVEIEALFPADFLSRFRMWNKLTYEGRAFLVREMSTEIFVDHIGKSTVDMVEA